MPIFGPKPLPNRGFVDAPPHPKNWQFGGVSGITTRIVLREDGQWDSYLPPLEIQRNAYFDSMACVTYASLNNIETLLFRKFDIKRNFSDRFTAKISGTTPSGNSMFSVAESIKTQGLVDEAEWPFGPWIKEFFVYYDALPSKLIELALKVLDEYKILYEFVWPEQNRLIAALKYGPLAVAICAYGQEVGGIFQRIESPANHLVTLYGYQLGQYWKIYDHYERCFKKLAWDSLFASAIRFDIAKKVTEPSPMFSFVNDTMYFVAEGRGVEFSFIAGKLRFDDPSKMERQILYRNDGDSKGHFKTILIKDLEGMTAYDLKGNDLGPAKNLAI